MLSDSSHGPCSEMSPATCSFNPSDPDGRRANARRGGVGEGEGGGKAREGKREIGLNDRGDADARDAAPEALAGRGVAIDKVGP
jgi:hypothetical protein